MVTPLEQAFPGLAADGYQVTSPVDKRYNCIAHAAGDNLNWWWPLPADVKEVFWPAGVTRAETLSAIREAFASLGFVDCASDDLEAGFDKIALYANDQSIPLHAARQTSNGLWTSKLGEREDIDHALHALEGETYGRVAQIMKRSIEGVTKR